MFKTQKAQLTKSKKYYADLSERAGSTVDVKNLKELLKQLDFSVNFLSTIWQPS